MQASNPRIPVRSEAIPPTLGIQKGVTMQASKSYYYGYVVTVNGMEIARCDDDNFPELSPGGQRRTALRICRKALAKGFDSFVTGYHGGLGNVRMIDDGEDLTPRPADYND